MPRSMRSWICVALCVLLAACGGGGGDSDPGGGGGGGGGGGPLSLSNVRTAADWRTGQSQLSLSYQVAATGMLVVSVSWYENAAANAPTFNGTAMTQVARGQTTLARLRVVNGAMYYLPVTAGQSGTVQVTFPGAAANRASMTAVTVAGASTFVGGQLALANVNPSLLSLALPVNLSAQSMVVTLMSSSSNVNSVLTGSAHLQVSNPTQPLGDFHDARSYTGHALLAAGGHSVGYAQDPATGPSPSWIYEAVMIAGTFR